VKLQEARGNNVVIQVYGFASNVAFSFEYQACLVRDDEVVVDELAIEHIATVCEESKPTRHIRDASP
jgi:hypothetical protein